MRRWPLLLALLLALGGAQAQPAVDDEVDAAPQQLLVMLPLPAPHYRLDGGYAGSYGEGLGRQARQRLAERLARAHGLRLDGGWAMPLAGLDCYVMTLPAGRAAAPVLAALARDGRIAWAQAMQLYQGRAESADPLPAAGRWQLAELHRLATGRGVRIAVIDSAVEAGHPDLAGQIAARENFLAGAAPAGELHGTAVAGIIAARVDNGRGIAGIAPQARLLALRACRQAGAASLCTSLSLAKALHYAIEQDAAVINLSLGGPPDRLLALLLDRALARGIAVVAALGPADAGFPASHPGVLAVGAAAPLPPGAVLAPGRDLPSTVPPGRWQLVSGSSYAAAHVSGLLALLRELGAGHAGGQAAGALVLGPARQVDSCATLWRQAGAPRGGACSELALSRGP